jgi:hypothetical protein
MLEVLEYQRFDSAFVSNNIIVNSNRGPLSISYDKLPRNNTVIVTLAEISRYGKGRILMSCDFASDILLKGFNKLESELLCYFSNIISNRID